MTDVFTPEIEILREQFSDAAKRYPGLQCWIATWHTSSKEPVFCSSGAVCGRGGLRGGGYRHYSWYSGGEMRFRGCGCGYGVSDQTIGIIHHRMDEEANHAQLFGVARSTTPKSCVVCCCRLDTSGRSSAAQQWFTLPQEPACAPAYAVPVQPSQTHLPGHALQSRCPGHPRWDGMVGT